MSQAEPALTNEHRGKMAAMKTCGIICCVATAALGIVSLHGQARAQTPGCTVMEVAGDDQAAFTQQRSPPVVDKARQENEPRALGRLDAAAPLVGFPLPRPRGRPRDDTDKDDATNISTREKAFAAGQSLADYCNLKIESATKR
jgi:hypothetical protein